MISHEPLTPLLDLDPDLGRLLSDDRLREARAEMAVRLSQIPRGPWDAGRLANANPEHVGLLLLDGVIAREVLISDTVSTELLGAGDLIRPWHEGEESRLLALEIRWTVLAEARMAVLDRRFARRLVRFPEVNAILLDRVTERAQRMGVSQAISQMNGVDRRLLALFWHLAERWGRMTRDGVAVPMALSHRVLAQLVGARRPTVSSALAELADAAQLVRRDDGTWLLTGEPIGVPTPEVERIVSHRRRLLPTGSPAPDVAEPSEPKAPKSERDALILRFGHARLQTDLCVHAFRESRDAAEELLRLIQEQRVAPRRAAGGTGG
jgi:CRP/FNR family transcriptional regulator, cyclic AMP receptor protein